MAHAAANNRNSKRKREACARFLSALGNHAKPAKMIAMSTMLVGSLIQCKIDKEICVMTFDRPESGANVFRYCDASAT
jgi:hypothetical protein